MNIKKFYYLLCSIVLLGFIVGMSFVLNSCNINFVDNRSKTLYVIAKVFFCLCYVTVMIKTILDTDAGNSVIVNIITVIAQCVPLLIRLLSQFFVFSFVIFSTALIVYLALSLSFSLLSKKTKVVQKQLEGKSYCPKDNINGEK